MKVNLIFAALIYFVLGAATTAVIAGQTEWTWTVPSGVEKIKVKSKRGEDTVMNYTFTVEPGQTFQLEVVK